MKVILADLDRCYTRRHLSRTKLIQQVPLELLYKAVGSAFHAISIGTQIVRSAAVVEQTFGGITANLWDDPSEWTLPETLSEPEKIIEYLKEVEETRIRGFRLLHDDSDLSRELMAPGGRTTLLSLLLDTLLRSAHYEGKARAVFEILSKSTVSAAEGNLT
jgi:hypothetical protein